MAWLTPLPACGVPVTVTGGHAVAHAPVQVDVPLLSASHRYMARPWPSTRALPGIPEMARSAIVPPEAAGLEAAGLEAATAGLLACAVADDAAGLAAVLVELLEQAVAARMTPAAQAAPAIQFLIIDAPHDNLFGRPGVCAAFGITPEGPPGCPYRSYRGLRIRCRSGSGVTPLSALAGTDGENGGDLPGTPLRRTRARCTRTGNGRPSASTGTNWTPMRRGRNAALGYLVNRSGHNIWRWAGSPTSACCIPITSAPL